MISIIVLTYNQERYIAQTLDGILSQEVDERIEIVIGDDHSSDSTSTICQQYVERYPDIVRYFYNTLNLGLVANFIMTLKQCRGQFCALCDGDDYWIDRNKLQKQVDIMHKDSDCVLVHTNRSFLSNEIFTSTPLQLVEAETPLQLFFNNYICVPTVFFRTDVAVEWSDNQLELSMKYDWRMQDLPLWLWLGTKGTFRYLPDVTAIYRVLPGTLSREVHSMRKYEFDKSVLSIKEYFYPYYSSINCSFRINYKEMEFHSRKRMLLTYGMMAREQIIPLLKLLPYWPIVFYRSIKRKITKH